MARINIEDTIYRDVRFHKLSAFEGKHKALGLCVAAWDLAQLWFLKHPDGLIPFAEWDKESEFLLLEKYGLAERKDNGIYVKGAGTQFEYLTKRVEAGRAGGLKTQGKNSSKLKQIKQNQPSSSSSSSSSSSTNNNTVLPDGNTTHYNFELIFNAYPKRKGSTGKAEAIKKLKQLVKCENDFNKLLLSAKNYCIECRKNGNYGTEFVAMASTFFGKKEIYKEWVDYSTSNVYGASDEELLKAGRGY